jgi:Protein of unknown function (DUF3048) N-terminal domain/Protein of unknown function (DUF3048) C-terminal domain
VASGCSGGGGSSPTTAKVSEKESRSAPQLCPLTGLEPGKADLTARPALGVKIENSAPAYPLSGLQDAEVVYEELVEGGITRFLALYHCTDTDKAGPVRSARIVDPAIMSPATRLLAAAGGNAIVRKVLDKAHTVLIDEPRAGSAMRRVSREAVAVEHTLYGDTEALRRIGAQHFDDPPPADFFEFGDLPPGGKKVKTITIEFSRATTVVYRFSKGKWQRFDHGEPLPLEKGRVAIDNVIVEEHKVDFAKGLVDVALNRSVEISDVTGSGRAVLFRDGRAFEGRWRRRTEAGRVSFETKSGGPMVLRRGTTWIELTPSNKGEVKGSFSFK